MHLHHIESNRFRNLKAVILDLPAGLTMVSGRNGQGKTSILESIYMLGTGRSFRTRNFGEIVFRDGGPLRVEGRVRNRVGETRLSVVGEPSYRRLLVDDTEHELGEYLGRLDLVALPNERMKVLREGPDERRRFLDRGVMGVEPTFLTRLGEYRRLVQHRNALLRKSFGSYRVADGPQLDSWDERLAMAARSIHGRRARYVSSLVSHIRDTAEMFFPGGEELHVRYRPSPAGTEELDEAGFESRLLESLAAHRERDQGLGFTSQGPHRDELVVELDGVDLRKYGSGGQVRAAMIALKLGKLSLLKEERGEAPLFLMDEFDADLDDVRAAALAAFLHQGSFQALVATAKESLADELRVPIHRVRMEAGKARTL